ncbi:MAG: hypothetical protein ACREX9_15710 [Gammaproteobacteria bacterium]
MKVAFGSIGFTVLILFSLGMEGIICIAMASPLIALLGWLGALLGYKLQRGGRNRKHSMLLSIALLNPLITGVEHHYQLQPPLQTVQSTVVINAPPSHVWRTLTEPLQYGTNEGLLFRAGVAYPTKTEVLVSGSRRFLKCSMPDGEALAEITDYVPGRRLEFSFSRTPPLMKELSLYKHIHPPHLDGYIRIRKGTFSLRPIPGGRTELKGITVYQHEIWPVQYWKLWTDFILDRMHLKVLYVIKQKTERGSN